MYDNTVPVVAAAALTGSVTEWPLPPPLPPPPPSDCCPNLPSLSKTMMMEQPLKMKRGLQKKEDEIVKAGYQIFIYCGYLY